MEPEIECIWMVLPTRTFYIWHVVFIHAYINLLSLNSIYIYHSMHAFLESTWSTDMLCTLVFAFAHATWHSYVLAGLHPDNPRSVCPDTGAWSIRDFLFLIGVHSGSVASPRIGTWLKLGDLIADPPDLFSLTDSRDPFSARDHLPDLSCKSFVIRTFACSNNVIFMFYWITCSDSNILGL